MSQTMNGRDRPRDGAASAPLSDDAAPTALRSQADFADALRWALQRALQQRARAMTWLDADFLLWPLDSAALLDALTAWLRLPQRQLTLIAADFGALAVQRPRFVAWRRTWAHAVHTWTPSADAPVRLPTLVIVDQSLAIQVFDSVHWRGRVSLDERTASEWRAETDALLQRCERSFPVRPLGL